MKLTLKLILFVCLFSSVTLAEGEMGSGGEGEMGSGGKTCPTPNLCRAAGETSDTGDNNTSETSFILTFIRTYLGSILG